MENVKYTFEKPFRENKYFIPKTILLCAKAALVSLVYQYKENKEVDFQKFFGIISSLKTKGATDVFTGQAPSVFLCPNLRAMPWWTKEDDPFLKQVQEKLEQAYPKIREEFLNVSADKKVTTTYSASENYGYLDPDAWTAYQLTNYGGVIPAAREKFPNTTDFIESLGKRVLVSEFLALEPNTVLPVHTDATNSVLAAQLCLDAPENCALRMMDETKDITSGKVVFIDQSFPHSAWNRGDKPRVILILSLLHPDINELEHDMIQKLSTRTQLMCLPFVPFILLEYVAFKLQSSDRWKNLFRKMDRVQHS